ncbi:MAG: CHAT domain-containing protein [Ardenticatenales bacterium]|nr:CHAT domain-containing protein [Ardenticatenales bacterium]
MTTFENFDLQIGQPQEGKYPISVQESPAGETEEVVWIPINPDDPILQPLLAALEQGALGAEELKELGKRLANVLLPPGPVRDLYYRSHGLTEARQVGLRLRLRIATPELAALPWEYSYDEQIADFFVLNPRLALVRYHSQPMTPQEIPQATPVPILLLISNPPPTEHLDASKECEGLLTALAPLLEKKQVAVDILYGGPEEERAEIEAVIQGRAGVRILSGLPSLDRLRDVLREGYRVVHYIGHGSFAEEGGVLLLTDAVGEISIASAQMLARELRGSRVAVVLLNSCKSAAEGSARSFMGLAPTLIRAGVPAVVAMQLNIADRSASCFSCGLYEALADGLPLDRAVTEGRKAIGSSGKNPELDWGIPVLFMRSPDGVLWQAGAAPADASDIPCPYPGMKPFTEADAGRFYGREKTVQEMVDRLRLQPFLALIGPSGSGKSSLMHAGLLPELHKSRLFPSSEWRVISMRPGPQPLQRMAAMLAQQLPGSNSDEMAVVLGREPARLPEYLASVLAPVPANTHCFLIVDQFEELFTQCKDSEQREQFLHALRHLSERRPERCLTVLAIRSDFLGYCQESLLWPHIEPGLIHLPPLSDSDLRRAIVEPARAVGGALEPALVERLLADAEDEKGALPLLQETLFLLWTRFLSAGRLTLADYEALGSGGRNGLQVALSHQGDAALAALPSEEQRAIARRIFLRLIEFGEGRNDTRRQQPLSELFPQPENSPLFQQVLDQLIQSRLVMSSHDEAAHTVVVDLTHEMLITGWPRLQQWLESYELMEVTRRNLALSATAWKENGDDPSYLYTGKRLTTAAEWAAKWEQEIDPREKAFLAASQAWSRRQQQEQQQRRVGLVALALVGLLSLALAGWLGQRALNRRTIGSELVSIAGGPAILGMEPRTVTLLPFQIEKVEVSNRQYRACVEAGPCEPPLQPATFEGAARDNLPVVSVTARQAQQYCTWLGRRLPTVIEWERAARGQEGRPWPWDEPFDVENYPWPTELVAVDSEPETSTPPPEQLFHLADNVSEWATLVSATCEGATCHEAWNGGDDVVIIGTAYDRPFNRFIGEFEQSSPNLPDESIGFRCVKEAS